MKVKYLAGLLSPFVGICMHHVKNLKGFVKFLDILQLVPMDLLMSFDVSSYTQLPIQKNLVIETGVHEENSEPVSV